MCLLLGAEGRHHGFNPDKEAPETRPAVLPAFSRGCGSLIC